MSDRKICYVNGLTEGREGEDLLTLNLIGSPVIIYPIKAAIESSIFDKIICLTDSKYIDYIVRTTFKDIVQISENYENNNDTEIIMEIDGSAVMLTSDRICDIYQNLGKNGLISVVNSIEPEIYRQKDFPIFKYNKKRRFSGTFLIYNRIIFNSIFQEYILSPSEALTIKSRNDLELALILKNKENKESILKQELLKRINEKKSVISSEHEKDTICLIGHSQFDNWRIKFLCGKNVINCGIRGISSLEYKKYILDKNLLDCSSDTYIVMHGTNDIVYNFSNEEILKNINFTFRYIREHNPNAKIMFVQCIHINGRADRDNKKIDELNQYLIESLPNDIIQIDTSKLDDDYGNLKNEYTVDGLHISDEGYLVLKKIIEDTYERNDIKNIEFI